MDRVGLVSQAYCGPIFPSNPEKKQMGRLLTRSARKMPFPGEGQEDCTLLEMYVDNITLLMILKLKGNTYDSRNKVN